MTQRAQQSAPSGSIGGVTWQTVPKIRVVTRNPIFPSAMTLRPHQIAQILPDTAIMGHGRMHRHFRRRKPRSSRQRSGLTLYLIYQALFRGLGQRSQIMFPPNTLVTGRRQRRSQFAIGEYLFQPSGN